MADRLLLNLTRTSTHVCEDPPASELGELGEKFSLPALPARRCCGGQHGGVGRHHKTTTSQLPPREMRPADSAAAVLVPPPLTLWRAPNRPDPSRQSLAPAPNPTPSLVATAANTSPSVFATSSPACIPKALARMEYPMPSMTRCSFTCPSASFLQMPYHHIFQPPCSGTDYQPSHVRQLHNPFRLGKRSPDRQRNMLHTMSRYLATCTKYS